ncbi:hypothetical protein V8E36_006638 [Tilletia maclaganii]
MSAEHLFDRLEGQGTSYTAEVVAAIARDSPWGDVAGFTDRNFFPHALHEKEFLDYEVSHLSLTHLPLHCHRARILVVTAGNNGERVVLSPRDELSNGIAISHILKIRSILVLIGGCEHLLLFVVMAELTLTPFKPHFSTLTPRAPTHVLIHTINVCESLVRALDALWARDKSILEQSLPPPLLSRTWPLLAERLSNSKEAYLVAAKVRASGRRTHGRSCCRLRNAVQSRP